MDEDEKADQQAAHSQDRQDEEGSGGEGWQAHAESQLTEVPQKDQGHSKFIRLLDASIEAL